MQPNTGTGQRLSALLEQGPLILGAVVGTELLKRGVPTPLPLWSAAALRRDPLAVALVHRDHVRAGARILVANTFRTDRRTAAAAGLGDVAGDLTRRAVELARNGIAAAEVSVDVLVAGSLAPVADCYRPDLVPDTPTLRHEHALRVRDLLRAGADLALIETMNTTREAVASLGACRAGGLPALVSFTLGSDGHLLSGEALEDAVAAVLPLEPHALLVNCCPLDAATLGLATLAKVSPLPRGAYANGRGRPDDESGWRFDDHGADRATYRAAVRRWIAEGATLIGGCCGTSPDWLDGLAAS